MIKASFIIPGTLLQSSSFVQEMRPSDYKLEKEDFEATRTFDLKSLGNDLGEYEIKIRSGFALDGTDDDRLALGENTYEMTMFILDNLGLKLSMLFSSECVGSVVDIMTNSATAQLKVDSETNILTEVLIPTLGDLTSIQAECDDSNKYKFFSKVLEYLDLWDKEEEFTAAVFFYPRWALAEDSINACQYLGQDFETKKIKTSSCFVIVNADSLDSKYFPGDTVELKLRAIQNKTYYPYTEDAADTQDFTWLVAEGTGKFAPDNLINAPGKTDFHTGEASIKWVLSCDNRKNVVRAVVQGIESTFTKDLFVSNTYLPPLEIVKSGDNQIGEKGKELAKPISFYIKDLEDNLPTKLNRFTIKWELFKDGNWEEVQGTNVIKDNPVNIDKILTISKIWTLDNVDGEQKIRATIKDKCGKDWNIKGNPVVFTANNLATMLINGSPWKCTSYILDETDIHNFYDAGEVRCDSNGSEITYESKQKIVEDTWNFSAGNVNRVFRHEIHHYNCTTHTYDVTYSTDSIAWQWKIDEETGKFVVLDEGEEEGELSVTGDINKLTFSGIVKGIKENDEELAPFSFVIEK